MPTDANRQFLDFEKPIKDLIDEIVSMKNRQEKLNLTSAILLQNWKRQFLIKEKR
jgi:acetyl-CoA carboxylase carboxyl transferase subunit alpha